MGWQYSRPVPAGREVVETPALILIVAVSLIAGAVTTVFGR